MSVRRNPNASSPSRRGAEAAAEAARGGGRRALEGPPSAARGRPRGAFTQHRRMDELRLLLHQHPRGLTLHEMAERLQVSTRSLRRYLIEIRRDTDLATENVRPGGAQRWRIVAADLPRYLAVRRTQAYAVLAARQLFEPLRGSALFEEIHMLSDSLLALARRPGRGPNAGVWGTSLESRFVHIPFAPKDYRAQADTIDDVFHAVADLYHLSCTYPRAQDAVYERLELQPYALVLYKDSLYCIARALTEDGPRTFALERMVNCRSHPERTFQLPSSFRLDDHAQGQFGLWVDGPERHEVIIDFDPAVADYVATRSVHPTQALESTEAGGVRMRLRLGRLEDVATWVLGFGSNARVLAPEALRAHVRDELRRALTRYDDVGRAAPAVAAGGPPMAQPELPFRWAGAEVLLG